MPQVQAEVDERKQLGQHGTRVHQMSHQRLPTQAGKHPLNVILKRIVACVGKLSKQVDISVLLSFDSSRHIK